MGVTGFVLRHTCTVPMHQAHRGPVVFCCQRNLQEQMGCYVVETHTYTGRHLIPSFTVALM